LISRATALKGRRITLLVTPSAPGKLVVSGTTGAGKKRVKVLSGTATVKSAKALKVTLKPTSKGKKALRPGRTVKIALTVSLKDATGKTTSSTKSVRVKIKRCGPRASRSPPPRRPDAPVRDVSTGGI
jgi:hypothetical protein